MQCLFNGLMTYVDLSKSTLEQPLPVAFLRRYACIMTRALTFLSSHRPPKGDPKRGTRTMVAFK